MGFPEGANKASSLADGNVLRMCNWLYFFLMFFFSRYKKLMYNPFITLLKVVVGGGVN